MSRPASWLSSVLAQAAVEARLTARRGENMLAMIGVPIAVLLFVGLVMVERAATNMHLPGVLVVAIVASGMVNLGIATAYERGYGVLKRLGGSPLGRSGLVAAKLSVVVVIALIQVGGLLAVAWIALGWRPGPDASMAAVAVSVVIGTAAFAGIGLAIAGRLRPEAALVVVNVLFLVTLGSSGAIVPLDRLPDALGAVLRALPVGALEAALGAALDGDGDLLVSLAIVAAWAIAALVAASRTFSWD